MTEEALLDDRPGKVPLRDKILADLHRHFKVKLTNDKLYWCIAYDFVFVHFMVLPVFMVAWRGTWQNADTLFDQVIWNGELEHSAITVLVLGFVGSAPLLLFQREINMFARNAGWGRFLLISRGFTVIRFYLDLLLWKGIWGFFDYIVGSSTNTSVLCMICGTIVLIFFRSFKATLGTPIGMRFDRPSVYISVPTIRGTIAPEHSWPARLSDTVLTLCTALVAITVFYGVWTAEDHYFDDLQEDVNVKLINAAKSTVFGFLCCIAVFILQFLILDLHSMELTKKALSPREVFNTGMYQALLMIALVGNVSMFRSTWLVWENIFLPDDLLTSRLLCQIIGILVLFMMYCGSTLHAGTVSEADRQRDGILVANFFLTYFLAKKQKGPTLTAHRDSGVSNDGFNSQEDKLDNAAACIN